MMHSLFATQQTQLYLYRLMIETDERYYKIGVHAETKQQAYQFMQQIYQLFIGAHAHKMQAFKQLNIESELNEQHEREVVLSEVERLKQAAIQITYTDIEYVSPDRVPNEEYYLGCRCGDNWCILSIFDKDKKHLFEWPIRSPEIKTYAREAEKAITEYKKANDPEVLENIQAYVRAFFSQNPKNILFHDVIKLMHDMQTLKMEHGLDDIDWTVVNSDWRSTYNMPADFIKAQVKALRAQIENDPTFCQISATRKDNQSFFAPTQEVAANSRLDELTQISPLMYAVYREVVSSNMLFDLLRDVFNNLPGHEVMHLSDSLEKMLRASVISINRLVKDGADVNAVDKFGRTPLMYIVLGKYFFSENPKKLPGRKLLVQLLLELGADPNIRDYQDKSAIDYFIEECGEEHPAVLLLQEAMPARVQLS